MFPLFGSAGIEESVLRYRSERGHIEAAHGLAGSLENLEDAVYTHDFENHFRLRRHGSELQIPVAFHGFVQTIHQHLDASAVDASDLRAIENDSRALKFKQGADIFQNLRHLACTDLFWQLHYHYGPAHYHVPPPQKVCLT